MTLTLFLLLTLTFVIMLLLYLNLLVSGFDVISPNSIVCLMSIFSLGIAIFFINKVDFEITVGAVALVLIAIISFMIPGLIVPPRHSFARDDIDNSEVYGKVVIILSCIFLVMTTFLYYREVSKVASLSGFNSSSPMGMLYYYRTATLGNTEAIAARSKIVGQMTIASNAISYLVIVDFVKRISFRKLRGNKFPLLIELISIIATIVQSILSGGRMQFLYYIEGIIFLFLFYYNKKEHKSISPSMVRKIILYIMLVYVAFFFLGGLTGKTSKLDFSSTLFVYAGSPIPAFSELLSGKVSFLNTSFGSDLLFGPIQLLNMLGFDIPINQSPAPPVAVGNLTTNIYGSFGRYYGTIGVLGLVLVNFMMGALYNAWYKRVKYQNVNTELFLVIYLLLSKALFDYCIEERFFMSVLSVGTILRIIYAVIFYYMFFAKFKQGRIIISTKRQS